MGKERGDARGALERYRAEAAPDRKKKRRIRYDGRGTEGRADRILGRIRSVKLQEPFYVGLGVCTHDKDTSETAVFSNV